MKAKVVISIIPRGWHRVRRGNLHSGDLVFHAVLLGFIAPHASNVGGKMTNYACVIRKNQTKPWIEPTYAYQTQPRQPWLPRAR